MSKNRRYYLANTGIVESGILIDLRGEIRNAVKNYVRQIDCYRSKNDETCEYIAPVIRRIIFIVFDTYETSEIRKSALGLFSEFYNSDYQNATGLFKSFSQTLSNYLNDKGLFLLLDLVSGDYEHRNTRPFTTQIMSDELNSFVKTPTSQLSYILPICCGFWSDGCNTQQCYIERQFEIKHSRRQRDITKVTYRVMVKKFFAHEILANVQAKEQYQMSYNSWHPRYCRNTRVIEKTNETELPNAFKLI